MEFNHLISFDEWLIEVKLQRKAPYVFNLESKTESLKHIGTYHTWDPEDPLFALISDQANQFRPDLILIDGGRAQLNAALSTRIPNFPRRVGARTLTISLAKKHNELFIQGRKKPLLLKNLPREISNLILHLRDEAHRFAISYHKKLRLVDLLPKS